MDFRILGRLEVVDDGQPVAFRGGKPATLLGVLLLESGRVVPASRLIDELWGEEPPASAAKLVQGYVHALRQSLGAGLIVTRQPGYLADTGRVDAARFERLAQEGQALLPTAPARAAERFREALGLWRGDALEGLVFRGAAAHRRDHLAERRLAVQEQRIDADLALGRHAALVTELRQLVAAHPYRERLCGQLMLALYRTRRQADALQAYRDTRRLLADELGLEPGPELRRLEQRILAHDPELELAPEEPETPAPTAATGHRLVTVVAAGVAAETDDAELAHRLFRQHTRLCAEVFGRHAGAVQSGDGGTVVGVFGLVELHEDDALRALRAADELRRRQGAVHIGVESGEVFVGTDARQAPYAVGAAVDRAVRLREAAAAGEVVLGSGTHRLAGPSLGAEDRDGAWLFRDIGAPVRPDTPLFVGRDRELDTLRAELTRAVRDRSCRLVTVVGDPGIGKSRLVRRFLHGLGDRVTAVTGTCLPYGEGITFHPVAEIVGQLTGGDPPARLDGLLRGVDRADVIARWVLGAIGPSAEAARTEETFWAVRRLAEHTAGVRPLVVVVEDLHLAEPTLLDLVDYLATFAGGAPILLLCTARPDLLETSPGWAVTRTLLNLDPLDTTESRRLADTMGDSLAERERAVLAAQGNPLFLEQLLAAGPSPGDRLPPTIQAVLAARLDRLEPAERLVLTHGSVEGQRFHRALLADLLDGAGDGDGHGAALRSLVRKRFLRAEAAPGGGDDAFRFAHVLIRDVAYCSLPKEVRAGLHERLGRQLAAVPDTADELIGHHLERAYRMRSDLHLDARELGATAARHLDAASGPALLRGDVPAAARLLERAAAMLGADDPERAAVLPRLGTALFEAGRLGDAEKVLREARQRARTPSLRARAEVELQRVRLQVDPREGLAGAEEVAQRALRALRRDEDAFGRCRAWCLRAAARWVRGFAADADDCWRRAGEEARRAGDDRELFEILGWRASASAFGPLPVPDAVRRCVEIRERVRSSPVAVAATLHPLGLLRALAGDFDAARELIGQANDILGELGRLESTVSHHECLTELLAGHPDAAEQRLRAGYRRLREMGEGALLATTAAMLARALHAQGRDDEAEQECAVSRRYAAAEDLPTQVMWRGVLARVLARRGRPDEAETLAAEAVRLAEPTDLLIIRADAWLDLSDVRSAAGHPGAAVAAEQAGRLAGLKGATALMNGVH